MNLLAQHKLSIKEFIRVMSVFCIGAAYSLIASTVHALVVSDEAIFVSPLASSIIEPVIETPDTTVYARTPQEPECNLSASFTPEVLRWKEDICRWSQEHQMEPNMIAAIMQIESCGNHLAVSATGVRGLFQVTGANLDGGDPFDPNTSMAKGPGKVLKNEIKAAKGNVVAAFAGYNGGGFARDYIAGEISRYQFYWKLRNHSSGYWWTDAKASAKINEVERYAQWANIYTEASENRTDTLQEWLDLGGSRLCQDSSQIAIDQPKKLASSQ